MKMLDYIKIILMRGLPGSGKSYYINHTLIPFLKEEGWNYVAVVSADHFFTHPVTGEYKFVSSQIEEAHIQCQRKFLTELELSRLAKPKKSVVIVDNTNTRAWEMAFYVATAKMKRIPYEIRTVLRHPEVCASSNIHGVPKETILKMHSRWEELPAQWKPVHYIRPDDGPRT